MAQLTLLSHKIKEGFDSSMNPLIVVVTESGILLQKEIGLEMVCNLNATCSISNFHFFLL